MIFLLSSILIGLPLYSEKERRQESTVRQGKFKPKGDGFSLVARTKDPKVV